MDNEKKKSLRSEQSLELLDELMEEILSRLPAKSLLRFRCVSKSWRSLIGSKRFINNHLQNISENQTRWRIIYYCYQHGLKQRSRQSYYDEPSFDPSPIDDPKNNHLTTADIVIVGPCNGLLCILKQPGCFFLWNPTIRISIELLKLDGAITKSGFGWDEGSDAYKVFAVVSEKEQNVGKVYSTKTNSWKAVEHGCLSLFDKYSGTIGKFKRGKIHWLTEGGLHIETFDVNTEAFGMMDHPFKPEAGVYMALCEHSTEYLGVVSENYQKKTLRIWLMKKYGVKESWVEKIVSTSNSNSNSISNSMTITCCRRVILYKESLVSPVF